MADWLQKLLPPASKGGGKKVALPDLIRQQLPAMPLSVGGKKKKLPRASIVYGTGAGAFIVMAVASLLSGAWFTALVVFIMALCFLGFAMHFIKHG